MVHLCEGVCRWTLGRRGGELDAQDALSGGVQGAKGSAREVFGANSESCQAPAHRRPENRASRIVSFSRQRESLAYSLPSTRLTVLPPLQPTPFREPRPRLPSSTTQFDLRALERYLDEPALNLYAPLLLGKGLHSIVAVRAIVGSWFEGLLENLAEVDGQGREMMPLGMRMVLNGVLLRKAKEQQ